jgi:hypothetical protein
MSQCKHKGCIAESLDDSVYCGAHQLITGKVRQRTTRGGDDVTRGGDDERSRTNNPDKQAPNDAGDRDGKQGSRGPARGG